MQSQAANTRFIQVTVKDLTFHRSLTWCQPYGDRQWVQDEDVFKMLMDPRLNEIESTQSRLESQAKKLFKPIKLDEP
jgi:hypothetical protein